MTDQTSPSNDVAVTKNPGRVWRPSGHPVHRKDTGGAETGRIVQQEEAVGLIGVFARYLKRPFVRLVIGLGIFILAAIVYDETVNFGDWTERKKRPGATKHEGLAPVQQTPEG